jgi:tripartite-type tricarboxylate transporter receptor subunit TctC
MKKAKGFFSFIVMGVILCAFLNGNSTWAADQYPTRPIEVILPAPPGGASEALFRILQKHMEKELGQPLVYVPKPGGGRVIGVTYVANARPDGYTLLKTGDIFTPILMGTATYKLEDLRVLAQIAVLGHVMCVTADAPWKTWQEFVEYAKKNPGMKYSHPGLGSVLYFRAENFYKQLGLKMVSLPAQGEAEVVSRLLGKHILISPLGISTAKPFLDAGKMRALFAFDDPKDFGLDPSIPNLPGLYGKDFPDVGVCVYLYAPAKTPEEIAQYLEKTLEKACKNPDFIAEAAKIGQPSRFVPGKIATEKSAQMMALVKAIIESQPKK